MGLFGGGQESESREEPKPFDIEWVINDGVNRIARLSMNREHPLASNGDIFKEMITPGLKKIIDEGNTILSISPSYIDPSSAGGEVLDYVVVAQPSSPAK